MSADGDLATPVNLGNPSEISVAELADLIIRMTQSPSAMVRLPLPTDDPRRRKPDIGRAERALSWRPAMPLAEGLARTIAYFEAELSAEAVAGRIDARKVGG